MFNNSSRCQRRSNQGRTQRLLSFSRSWQRTVLAPAAIAAMLLPVALAPPAHAISAGVNTTWQGGDGNWITAAKWSQGVPTSTTDASNTTSGSITSNSDGNVYSTFNSSGMGNFYLSGGSLTGGAFSVKPSALFQISGGATLRNATVSGAPITFIGSGVLDHVTANSNLDLSGGSASIVNNLTLNATANITNNNGLFLRGAETIGGTGTLSLGTVGGAAGYVYLNNQGDSNNRVTLGPNITVDAQNGNIAGEQYNGTLVNQGTLQASGAGRTLSINTNGYVNQGTIKATNGGKITLSSSGGDNTNHTITADGTGSLVTLAGSLTNTGGTLQSSNGGAFVLGGVSITGGTFAGQTVPINVTSGSNLTGVGGNLSFNAATATLRILGGATLADTSSATDNQGLYLTGAETIGGTGTLSLGTVGGAAGYVYLNNQGDSNNRVTLGPNITVDAQNGTIGNEQYGGTLVNQGTLQANGAGRTLSISTNGGLVNNGAIVANGAGSTVTVSSLTTGSGTVSTGTGGTVTFSGGSAIQQAAGTSQIDGNVNLGSGSTFTVAGGTLKGTGTVTGNVVSNGGTVAPGDSPGTLTVNGSFTQNSPAALEIEFANTAHDTLVVSGNAALNQGILNVSFLGTTINSSSFNTFSFLSYGGTLSGSTTNDPLMLFSNEFKSATFDSSYGITNGHYVNGPAGPYSSSSIYLLTQNVGNLLITPKQISPAAAPEPSQYAAFAIGLLGLGALALKARKRSLAA